MLGAGASGAARRAGRRRLRLTSGRTCGPARRHPRPSWSRVSCAPSLPTCASALAQRAAAHTSSRRSLRTRPSVGTTPASRRPAQRPHRPPQRRVRTAMHIQLASTCEMRRSMHRQGTARQCYQVLLRGQKGPARVTRAEMGPWAHRIGCSAKQVRLKQRLRKSGRWCEAAARPPSSQQVYKRHLRQVFLA